MATMAFEPLFVPIPAGASSWVLSCQICTQCPRRLGAHVRTHHSQELLDNAIIAVRDKWFIRASTLGVLRG